MIAYTLIAEYFGGCLSAAAWLSALGDLRCCCTFISIAMKITRRHGGAVLDGGHAHTS